FRRDTVRERPRDGKLMNQNDVSLSFSRRAFHLTALALAVAGCSDGDWARRDSVTASTAGTRSAAAAQVLEPYQIEITGSKDRWHVRYPAANGKDAKELALNAWDVHVPLHKDVVFVLNSKDYVYILSIPEYG